MAQETSPARVTAPGLTPALLAALGAIAILGPLGTDVFLPALPAIADAFDARASAVQGTLTGFTWGLAAGQLLAGPLSDAVGRRLPILAGSAVMAVACTLASVAPSLALLVTACAVAGVACSFGLVLSRAVIADLAAARAEITRGNSLLGGIISLGAVVGPILGVGLTALGGWRWTFGGIAAIAAAAFVAVLVLVPESHPPEHRLTGGLGRIAKVSFQAARSRHFLSATAVGCLAFMVMFAYISFSPFLIQEILGFSRLGYATVFGANGAILIATSLLSGRLARRGWPDRRIITLGMALQSVGALAVGMAVFADHVTASTVLPGLAFIPGSMGLILGPVFGEAIVEMGHAVGTTTAILGTVQWLLAGAIAPLVSSAGSASAIPFGVFITLPLVLAWALWIALRPTFPAPVPTQEIRHDHR